MVKNLPAIAGDAGHMAQSLHQKEPLEEEMATHSSSLAGKISWMGSLAGCSPWGHKELDTTERLSTHEHRHAHEF